LVLWGRGRLTGRLGGGLQHARGPVQERVERDRTVLRIRPGRASPQCVQKPRCPNELEVARPQFLEPSPEPLLVITSNEPALICNVDERGFLLGRNTDQLACWIPRLRPPISTRPATRKPSSGS
jgi:hypothetical protein